MMLSCGDWNFRFGATGGLSFLNNTQLRKQWASDDHLLGEYVYTTFDSSDFVKFTGQYCYCAPDKCEKWISLDFGKPGVDVAKPVRGQWTGKATTLYSYDNANTCSYYLQVVVPADLHTDYGAPTSIWIRTNFTKTAEDAPTPNVPLTIPIDYFVYDKTPTRLPESHSIKFDPVISKDSISPLAGSWWVDKCGELINPLDVVVNGSMHVHGQLGGVQYKSDSLMFLVEALDISVVSFGSPNPFPTPMMVGDPNNGIYFNFCNNLWGTNYVMWYPFKDEDANFLSRFRFTLQ